MIVCSECGQRNNDKDTFCGSCGRFLEWTGEKVTVAVDPGLVEQAQQEATGPKPSLFQRVLNAVSGPPEYLGGGTATKTAAGGGPPKAGPPKGGPPKAGPPKAAPAKAAPPPGKAAPPPPGGKAVPPPPGGKAVPPPPGAKAVPPPPGAKAVPPPPGAKAVPPPPGAKAVPPPPGAKSVPPPPRPAALVAPVEAPLDEDDDDAPELAPQPEQAKAAPRHRLESTRKIRAGDLVCGECGEANLPTRKFCSRCGESLATAQRRKQQWWRRVFRSRGPKVLKAGKRPPRPGASKGKRAARAAYRRIRTSVFIVLLAFGLLAGFYPPLRTYVADKVNGLRTAAAGVVSKSFEPVRPTTVTANAELPDHPGKAAFDQFKNTYWAAQWSPDRQPAITLDLGKTVALVKVIVTSGASDDFSSRNRPSIVNLAYSNEKSDTITLKDTPEPQQLTLTNGLGAKTVKIQVLNVYGTQGSAEVAITEIELFAVG